MNIVLPDGGELSVPREVARRFLAGGGKLRDIPERVPQKVPYNRRVRVLVVVHGWFPGLAAGSERMMQHLLSALPPDEFDIHVLSFGVQDYPIYVHEMVYEGLPVTIGFEADFEPDIILTHHGIAARVVPTMYAQYPGAFVVAVYHNERYDIPDIQRLGADLNIYNTRWVKQKLRGNGIIVHPPVEPERHRVDQTGSATTLVNLQENKGIDTFRKLTEVLPDFPFLGVVGTHGLQALSDWSDNVEIFPTTQDMRDVWRKTRVILMPSEYESYGMVAAEACVNGIPVIAHPTPGLVECLGWAGIFVQRDDVEGYARVLNQLYTDPEFYRVASESSRVRGGQITEQTEKELRKFVNRMRKMVRP